MDSASMYCLKSNVAGNEQSEEEREHAKTLGNAAYESLNNYEKRRQYEIQSSISRYAQQKALLANSQHKEPDVIYCDEEQHPTAEDTQLPQSILDKQIQKKNPWKWFSALLCLVCLILAIVCLDAYNNIQSLETFISRALEIIGDVLKWIFLGFAALYLLGMCVYFVCYAIFLIIEFVKNLFK